MARKRASGEGTIRQLPSGNWLARITIDGDRKSYTDTTQRKVREWLTETRRDLDTEDYIDPSDMPLGEWWNKWTTADKKDNVKAATIATYAASRARLPAELLDAQIGQITRADVQSALNGLTQAGLSPATVRMTAIHVKACFNAAAADKMIRKNPAIDVKLPAARGLKGELHLLTDFEYDSFVKWCKAPCALNNVNKPNQYDLMRKPYKDALFTILNTGMRKMECINLLWADLTGDLLKIRGTKNAASFRTIILDQETLSVIDARRKTTKSFYIFETTKGKLLDGHLMFDYMVDFGHNVHDLRHTYATRAISAGVDVKTLSEILGHSDVATTLRLYVHPTEDSKRDAVNRIVAARTTIIADVK